MTNLTSFYFLLPRLHSPVPISISYAGRLQSGKLRVAGQLPPVMLSEPLQLLPSRKFVDGRKVTWYNRRAYTTTVAASQVRRETAPSTSADGVVVMAAAQRHSHGPSYIIYCPFGSTVESTTSA